MLPIAVERDKTLFNKHNVITYNLYNNISQFKNKALKQTFGHYKLELSTRVAGARTCK